MTANKPMTGEQLEELMTIAVNMQRDSEKVSDRPAAMFAYAVQVAVLELRKVRNDAAALAAENAGLKSNLMFWDVEDPEAPYDNPGEIAEACSLNYNEEFVVQVQQRVRRGFVWIPSVIVLPHNAFGRDSLITSPQWPVVLLGY